MSGMRTSVRAKTSGRRCSAFTLMETMVALALLGMIMMSMGTSLTLYWKYRSLSRDRVTSAQILRGLLDDLTSDLRRVAAPNVIPSGSRLEVPDNVQTAISEGRVPAGLERTLRVQEQHLNLDSTADAPIALAGTSHSLAILTEHDNPRFDSAAEGDSALAEHHVVWWMNSGSPIRISLSHTGSRISSTTVTATHQPQGLVRLVQPLTQKTIAEVFVSARVASCDFPRVSLLRWQSVADGLEQLAAHGITGGGGGDGDSAAA